MLSLEEIEQQWHEYRDAEHAYFTDEEWQEYKQLFKRGPNFPDWLREKDSPALGKQSDIQCMAQCPVPLVNPKYPGNHNSFELCLLEPGHEGKHHGHSGAEW